MIPVFAKSGLMALCAFFLLNCRSSQPAYFQQNATRLIAATTAPESLPAPELDSLPVASRADETPASTEIKSSTRADQVRHLNPDAAPARRRTWLQQPVLFAPTGDSYTAQRLPTTFSTKRAVPKGAVYALAGSTLPYGLLLIRNLPNWAWLASLALPVASLFLATGSIAKIRRNRGQFRGKGWAIAALLLATSYMGVALYALAALAASGTLWE